MRPICLLKPWPLLLVCGALAAHAAPADDHARGLRAYQQGDVTTAMAALRPAAKAGHAPAQSLLGLIMDRAGFVAEAAQWWQQAAAQSDAEAHMGLANLYLTGRGVAKDEKRALQHFSEAAAQGHAAAVEAVARAWLKGELGARAESDPAAARAAIQRAAEAGHLPSADALVLAYREGRYGLPVDAQQAEAWKTRAAAWRAQRVAAASQPVRARP